MTDEQIIQALKCCMDNNKGCEECPLEQLECITNEDNRLLRLAFDLITRQKEEKEHLEYVLMAVMHSVDKWLEGDELKQDEANRACTMREKTLKITEKLHKKIDGLQKANQESFVAIEKRKAEIERLNTSNNSLRKSNEKMFVTISKQDAEIERLKETFKRRVGKEIEETYCYLLEKIKSEAYKEFAERLKTANSTMDKRIISVERVDNTLKELTRNLHGTCTEGGNEDGTNHS